MLILSYPYSASAENVHIAAAASLSHVLKEVAEKYRQESGESVAFTFGSSGNLTRQIIHGAPFDLFLSANRQYAELLIEKGIGVASEVYAQGHLVLYVPNGSAISIESGLESVEKLLNRGELKRIAIPNPRHAPYGQLAQHVLTQNNLWSRLKPYLVIGENAAQAAHFATAGSVDAALLPRSLAQLPALLKMGQLVELPSASTRPLDQYAVLMQNANPAARDFFKFLHSNTAKAVYLQHGFSIPGQDQHRNDEH